MLEGAWRGDLLMQRGLLHVRDLWDAVQAGYLVPEYSDGTGVVPLARYFGAGTLFAAGCFYKLTAKGWWEGVATGASFESPAEKRIAAVWDDD